MTPEEIDAQIAALKAKIADLQAVKSKIPDPSDGGGNFIDKVGNRIEEGPITQESEGQAAALAQFDAEWKAIERSEANQRVARDRERAGAAIKDPVEDTTGEEYDSAFDEDTSFDEEPVKAAKPEAAEADFNYDALVAKRAKKQGRKTRKADEKKQTQDAWELSQKDTQKAQQEWLSRPAAQAETAKQMEAIEEAQREAKAPDPMEGKYETMLAEDAAEAQEEEFRYGEEPTGSDDPRYAEAPSSEKEALSLFDVVHGKGSFDPASSVDLGKLKQIKENLKRKEFQGLDQNQFALKMYRGAA